MVQELLLGRDKIQREGDLPKPLWPHITRYAFTLFNIQFLIFYACA